uniref:partitioning defective 3 homolog isoform X1 n=1 Tax=Vespula vulgaris TaxID=7454 RepID=UPI00223B6FEA|nr:partitioning defective 3 homolog isoform X1 [Vespula vulgaris]
MKVTVCFENVRVVVPCGDGTLLVKDLMHEAILRYKKATGKNDSGITINSLSTLTGGGLLDPDDRLCDVADDREQIVAHFTSNDVIHAGGDGASSVGTNSPDFFHSDGKDQPYMIDSHASISTSSIKREGAKRLSMHALSNREPTLTTYSAQSLPRESRRREPLGQDAKACYDFASTNIESLDQGEIREIVIKNEAGPLGLHVVPCYDLLGNDQGLRVEGIEPNGRIARDGQIDLHDKIIKINGHNLLHIPFSKVQDIFRTCMTEKCLKISIVKHKKSHNEKSIRKNHTNINESSEKSENEDNVKRLQCSNYNILQTANTRKIGRMIEIELTKGNNGLGFSVTTRDNPAGGHCPIYIKNILSMGAAVEDGRLRPGDRLLEVNKKEMTGKSQAEVVSLLRSIPAGGKVRLVVSRQEEVSSNTLESHCQTSSINQPLEVIEGSKYWNALDRSPTNKNNDFQEKLNVHDYEKCTFKTVKPSEDIVLSPRKNRMILTLDIPVHDSEKAGLGVSVKGKTSSTDDNTNMDLGIFIKSVLHGGAASRDGRLRTNDQLLNVNGVSLLGLSNSDAMETLRRAMLNTNSSVTGVITLTIARRLSSYDTNDKNIIENMSSHCKIESSNSIYISDSTKVNDGRVKEKNNLNSQSETLDNAGLLSCVTASPWNPVIDRLTEQYNKNSLRNESYCIATNKTWIEPVSVSNVKKITIGPREDRVESVLLEESNNECSQPVETKKNVDDKDSQYSGDPTYDSQLSLEEFNSSSNKFSRDALGRQSMSEKRHAALDAKNTDTYKRNKKLREGRENKNIEQQNNQSAETEDCLRKECKTESYEKSGIKITVAESTSCDNNMKVYDKKSLDPTQSEYVYTIPGCNNKYTSPRKHWLVDDVHGEISSTNHFKDEHEGFSNSRGDVKQASLNSALDDRYKRSRKKGGIRSMLRLGKNRKSLNFGDSIEGRHENMFQISIPNQLFLQQKRFRGKINIQKPRAPHYTRALFQEFVSPFYENPKKDKTLLDLCTKAKRNTKEKYNPYHHVLAREVLNWFDNSKMIAFLHKNSITQEEAFELAVPLRRKNMYLKSYGSTILELALKDTTYKALDLLYQSPYFIIFSPEKNVIDLEKILKKFSQVILIAGILEGKLLNVNEFKYYGRMDLTAAQVSLVQVLQSAGGNNLKQQITHHQSALISRLQQIGARDVPSNEND